MDSNVCLSRCDRTAYLHFFYPVAVVMRSPSECFSPDYSYY
ncbi:hypothetical protein [Tolypothrix tenuis]